MHQRGWRTTSRWVILCELMICSIASTFCVQWSVFWTLKHIFDFKELNLFMYSLCCSCVVQSCYKLVIFVCVGGQVDRSATPDHRVWPVWLCAWPSALPLPQQPSKVHWDLRAEGKMYWLCVNLYVIRCADLICYFLKLVVIIMPVLLWIWRCLLLSVPVTG